MRPQITTPEWLLSLTEAAKRMPVPVEMRPPASGGRSSAVLLLFGEGEAGPDVLLIQRNTGLRRHSGQPAFPGGALEPQDAGPVDCALREAEEETGVSATESTCSAPVPEFYIPPTGFRVTPVLAWWHTPSEVRAVDTDEVASVTRVPIAELADPANRVRTVLSNGRTGPAFRVRGMLVWGFTAGILDRLLVLGGWERPWRDQNVEVIDVFRPVARDGGGTP